MARTAIVSISAKGSTPGPIGLAMASNRRRAISTISSETSTAVTQ
jgi:hypothetical protein